MPPKFLILIRSRPKATDTILRKQFDMTKCNIAILGSGALARATCYALANICDDNLSVAVLSRTGASVDELCYVANTRASLSGSRIQFIARKVGVYTCERLGDVLCEIEPQLVLNCASVQSPWESRSAPSAWTDLLADAGFGLTLPLQAIIPIEVSSAIARQANPPLFINASFPDAVNPLLKALRLPIFCGCGNVALLQASISQALAVERGARVKVLGHHWHLYPPKTGVPEAMAWLNDTDLQQVGGLLRNQREAARPELNHVNGLITAQLLVDLILKRNVHISLPGPLGMPGGYPVQIVGQDIRIDLPHGMTLDQAMELNSRWAQADGVQVREDGLIVFSERGCAAIHGVMPNFSPCLAAEDIVDLGARLSWLRKQLRQTPTRRRDAGDYRISD